MFAMGAPILVGTLFGHPTWGAVASVGTLAAPFVGRWTFRQRAVRLSAHAGVMAVTYTLGAATAQVPPLTVAVLAVVATVSFLVGGLFGAWASPFAVIAANCAILGTGLGAAFGAGDPSPVQGGALVLLAGLWVAASNVIGLSPRGVEPQVNAVTAAYAGVADYLTTIGTEGHDQARITARRRIFEAWDSLGPDRPPHGSARERLYVLLQDAQRIMEGSVAVSFRMPDPVPEELPTLVRAAGLAVRDPDIAAVMARPEAPPDASSALARLYRLVGQALSDAVDAAVEPASSPTPLRETLADRMAGMQPVREVQVRVALRLGLAVGFGQTIGILLGIDRGYWIALTTLFVLQPDPSNTRMRALQRALGTVAGVALLGPVLLLQPDDGLIALGMITVGYLLPGGFARSYLSASTLLTLYALLLTDAAVTEEITVSVLAERIVDTVLGCVIAVVAIRLLWPRAATRRLPQALASAMRAEARLVRARYVPPEVAPAGVEVPAGPGIGSGLVPHLAQDRRRLLLVLLNIQSLLERSLSEPRARWPDRQRLWPVAMLSLRAGVRMATRSGPEDTQPQITTRGAAELAESLEALADAVAAGRVPPALPWSATAAPSRYHEDVALLSAAVREAAR